MIGMWEQVKGQERGGTGLNPHSLIIRLFFGQIINQAVILES